MVYDWKLKGMYPVSAQDAGDELNRIYRERGKIEAEDVVDESRPETSVLHPCFEWRDTVAAEEWRKHQARRMINCLVTKSEQEDNPAEVVRAVFHVQGAYHPTEVIIQDDDKYDDLERTALGEFLAAKRKFSLLSDRPKMKRIFNAIDAASAELYS